MMDKMKMRRMAMEKMMGEGPSIAIKIKKDEMDGMDDMPEMEGKEGFVQMAVSPAEKKMIMEYRKNGGMDSMDSDEDMEGEYA